MGQLDLCAELGIEEEAKKEDATTTAPAKKKPEDEKIKAPATVCYAGHKIIIDESITLEEVRKRLEGTFPELTSKRTEMTYDKKKAMIVPIIKASKGGNVRSFHTSLSSLAKDTNTPVRVLAGKDGYYEVRQNDIGLFCARTDTVPDLDVCKEKFTMTLPFIPHEILVQTIAFFRAHRNTEAVVNVYYDKIKEHYFAEAPSQRVTESHFDADRPQKEPHTVLVMEIHSHNTMSANFSSIDNQEQKETMLFTVIGNINKYFPEMDVRASCGGKYIKVNPNSVFKSPYMHYPQIWNEKVVSLCSTLAEPKEQRKYSSLE